MNIALNILVSGREDTEGKSYGCVMTTNYMVDGGKLISSSWTNNPEDCAFHCFEIERCDRFSYDKQAQIYSCVLFSGSSVKQSLGGTTIVGSCSKDEDGKSTTEVSKTQTTPHEEVIPASSIVNTASPLTSAWENSTKPTLPITTGYLMHVTEEDKDEVTVDANRSNCNTKHILIIIACSVLAILFILVCSCRARRKLKRVNASSNVSLDKMPRIETEPSHYFSAIYDPNSVLGRV